MEIKYREFWDMMTIPSKITLFPFIVLLCWIGVFCVWVIEKMPPEIVTTKTKER